MEVNRILQECQQLIDDREYFNEMLAKKVNDMKSKYNISKIDPYVELVHSMVMCLIVDFYLEAFKQNSQEVISQLSKLKNMFAQKVREQQSLLIMQNKMRENYRNQALFILVSKLTHSLLQNCQQKSSQQALFSRLNFIVNGKSVSDKCYSLSIRRATHHSQQIYSKSKTKAKFNKSVERDNTEFKRIFLPTANVSREQNKLKSSPAQSLLTSCRNQGRILKLLTKVKTTIESESNKFQVASFKNSNTVLTKPLKTKQSELQVQETIQPREKIRRVSTESLVRKKISSRKRVGTLNEKQKQHLKLRVWELKQLNLQNKDDSSGSMSSLDSKPEIDQNWFKTENKPVIKRVYTIAFAKNLLGTINQNC